MAGVEMRLISGGVRELHWHTSAEWAYMIYGNARITAVDAESRSFVNDVERAICGCFPVVFPTRFRDWAPDGCKFLLVFNDGNFNEFETFLLTDWFTHTPKEVLAKNFGVPESTFDNVPKKSSSSSATDLPRPLEEEQKAAAEGTGSIDNKFLFKASAMKPTRVRAGGEVRIIDNKNFPSRISRPAIVRLKPGGLRELQLASTLDEWQYYVSGKGRMTVFEAGGKREPSTSRKATSDTSRCRDRITSRTWEPKISCFWRSFQSGPTRTSRQGEWLAHTPARLVNEHLKTGKDSPNKLPKEEAVITPL